MKYLKISNKGKLDIRLFSLMGGTTKDNDTAKIGQWGSGLKYALCFLLREKIAFKIFVDEEEVKIETRPETIRDEVFEVVYVNGEKTSLTTKMGGKAWKEWQCIREIYSNALDEGNATKSIEEEAVGEKETTTFYIELTPKMLEIYNNWSNYFIENKQPIYENNDFKLYPTGGTLKMYKQGVLIGEREYPALFHYDFKHANINELREYQGSFGNDLSQMLYRIDDVNTIKYIIENITEKHYEGSQIDFKYWRDNSWDKPNKAWEEAFGNAKIITQEIKTKCEGKKANIDLTHCVVLPKNLYKGLNHHIENISALRLADKVNEFYEIYDEDLNLKLKQCLAMLEHADYWMHPEVTYIFGEFGTGTVMARVNLDSKEIMLSQKLKDQSLFNFCATLIEENEHLRTGMSDESREFQQHFIDLYTKSILDKAEIKL